MTLLLPNEYATRRNTTALIKKSPMMNFRRVTSREYKSLKGVPEIPNASERIHQLADRCCKGEAESARSQETASRRRA